MKIRSVRNWGLLIGLCLAPALLASCGRDDRRAGLPPDPDAPALSLSLSPFAFGLDRPVGIYHAGLDDDRLFVIQQPGVVRIVQADGTVLDPPFLDITSRVDSTGGEEGLLGLAFHPDYVTNGFFYLNYTAGGHTRISRFSVSGDPHVADPGSETVLLTVAQPFENHNAGDIHFGPDGFLYIPLGDGGSGGDRLNQAQDPATLLGKVVRIDIDSRPGSPPDCVGLGQGNYTLPSNNPMADGPGGACDEIWAVGLRNPWRSSFDRQTGDFYLADVGQNAWEEVNVQPADSAGGENYGWRCYEGNHPFNSEGCGPVGGYTFPIFEYPRSSPECSVIGGYVYRGSQFPVLVGRYLLTDFCSGKFWDLSPDGSGGWRASEHTPLSIFGFVSFGEDAQGEHYVVNRAQGIIYRVEASP